MENSIKEIGKMAKNMAKGSLLKKELVLLQGGLKTRDKIDW